MAGRGLWQLYFYLDFNGRHSCPILKVSLEDPSTKCIMLVAGSSFYSHELLVDLMILFGGLPEWLRIDCILKNTKETSRCEVRM